MKRIYIYWACQWSGWLLFVLLNFFFLRLSSPLDATSYYGLTFTFIYGIVSSHVFRNIIISYNLLRLSSGRLITLFTFSSLMLGSTYQFFRHIFLYIITGQALEIDLLLEIPLLLNISLVYLLWSLIYFMVHFVENYKREEIRKLKYEALRSEMEFNTLKTQLNPHFLFNALNSIRALIDESPQHAKTAVTSLSKMLRSGLQLGKREYITLSEEMDLVQEYLQLEKIRYEERLVYSIGIEEKLLQAYVPPMVVQTLTENAIKHGISGRAGGGRIDISASTDGKYVYLTVINSGELKAKSESSGIGLRNLRQRMALLFGDNASVTISAENDQEVKAALKFPIKYDSGNSR